MALETLSQHHRDVPSCEQFASAICDVRSDFEIQLAKLPFGQHAGYNVAAMLRLVEGPARAACSVCPLSMGSIHYSRYIDVHGVLILMILMMT